MPPATASAAALPEHAYFCFEVINAKLNGTKVPKPDFDESEEL